LFLQRFSTIDAMGSGEPETCAELLPTRYGATHQIIHDVERQLLSEFVGEPQVQATNLIMLIGASARNARRSYIDRSYASRSQEFDVEWAALYQGLLGTLAIKGSERRQDNDPDDRMSDEPISALIERRRAKYRDDLMGTTYQRLAPEGEAVVPNSFKRDLLTIHGWHGHFLLGDAIPQRRLAMLGVFSTYLRKQANEAFMRNAGIYLHNHVPIPDNRFNRSILYEFCDPTMIGNPAISHQFALQRKFIDQKRQQSPQ
jgi:hypothetical protein